GGRDDRLFERHGFEQSDGEAFTQAGQRHQIGGCQKITDVFAETKEMNDVLQAEPRRLLFQSALDGARPRQPELNRALHLRTNRRYRREKIVESLAIGETA